MNKTLICFLISVSIIRTLLAQESDVFNLYKSKFPDAPAVFVDRSELVSILVKNDSLEIFADVIEDMLHLKTQTDAYSSRRVFGSHFSQVKDLKAKTLIWDRNKFKEMHVTDFKKNNDRDDGIFYDDSYNYSFNFPSVEMGNRTHLQYRNIIKDSRFMAGYVFTSYIHREKLPTPLKLRSRLKLYMK